MPAKGFFDDSPWFNIPTHRLAIILVEPLYPRLGLLGGSPSNATEGKMSKLAALAAKRRQKENKTASTAASDRMDPREGHCSASSGVQTLRHPPPEQVGKTLRSTATGKHSLDHSKNPLIAIPSSDADLAGQLSLSAEAGPIITQSPPRLDPPVASRANPSPFATTIVASNSVAIDLETSLASDFASTLSLGGQLTKPFDFADPSPDDVVTKAQSSKGSI